MAISLQKGGNTNLTKAAPNLTKMIIGLGWDARATSGPAFDLDGSAFMLKGNAVRNDKDFIFYGNLAAVDGSVIHSGDNRTGDAAGDDETISIDLTKIPADVDRIAFSVTIHDGEKLKQNFGMVSKAYIRVVDANDKAELVRYDLSEDGSTETAMIFGEVYRNGTDWKFRAVGQGFTGGLAHLCKSFGVDVG